MNSTPSLGELDLQERAFVDKQLSENPQFIEILDYINREVNPQLSQSIRQPIEKGILV